jgi:hypothetical protein
MNNTDCILELLDTIKPNIDIRIINAIYWRHS